VEKFHGPFFVGKGGGNMTYLGKRIRMERIINRNTRRTVIVPMDHGISMGPIDGLKNMKDAIQKMPSWSTKGLLVKGTAEKVKTSA
jgi:class I fructose-bisphosphate aldolase